MNVNYFDLDTYTKQSCYSINLKYFWFTVDLTAAVA